MPHALPYRSCACLNEIDCKPGDLNRAVQQNSRNSDLKGFKNL
jgi:hypothetical protein